MVKDALLIALVIGGAYLLLRDRSSGQTNNNIPSSGNTTVDRIERGFNSGFRITKEAKSLWEDIF